MRRLAIVALLLVGCGDDGYVGPGAGGAGGMTGTGGAGGSSVWATPPACDPQPADPENTEGYYRCPEGSPSQYAIPRGICMDVTPELITVRSGCTVTKGDRQLWVCAGASCDY